MPGIIPSSVDRIHSSDWRRLLALVKADRAAVPAAPRCRFVEMLEPRMLLTVAPVGLEFQVNTSTAGNQELAKNAMDRDGDSVVVWDGPDNSGAGIYAQRYDASGRPQGNEFLVNTFTASQQDYPNVAMDGNGNFIIAWESTGQDGSRDGIYAQRYDAAGERKGNEFRANTLTGGSQEDPQIAYDAAGNFLIAWSDSQNDGSGWGIYAQRFAADGTMIGSQFRVNTFRISDQRKPAVAMDDAGDVVIAWHSRNQDGSGYGIYAQRYDAAGQIRGGEFRVNTFTANDQYFANVAMDAQGDFIVTWRSYLQDGSLNGAYAQRYDASGVPQNTEFRLNSYTNDDQRNVYVAMDPAGNFIATWQSFNQDGSGSGIYGQRFNAAGLKEGPEFLVNTTTAGDQIDDDVAVNAVGDFVVTWDSADDQDGSQGGIYAQRYAANRPPTATGISDVMVSNGAAPSVIDLFSAFADAETADSGLVYTITQDTSPSLFSSTPIDPLVGTLTLAYAPGAVGTSTITVRAADPDGLLAEATFQVTVHPLLGPLIIPMTAGDDNVTVGQDGVNNVVTFNGQVTIVQAIANTTSLNFMAVAGGNDSVTFINSGTYTIGTSLSVAALAIADQAKVVLAPGGDKFVRTSALDLAQGALDLSDNDLILDSADGPAARDSLAILIGLLLSGRNAGDFKGSGLTSSVAASDPLKRSTLAAILNEQDGSPLYPKFAGQAVDKNSILVKYTYYGDMDLNGKVDGADYFLIDNGFLSQFQGYRNGDLDLNGKIDGADYFLIDSAFLGQTAALSSGGPRAGAASLGSHIVTSSFKRGRGKQHHHGHARHLLRA